MQQEIAKTGMDVAAGGIAITTLAGWLPPIAALITIIYGSMRIYEMCMGPGAMQRLFKKLLQR